MGYAWVIPFAAAAANLVILIAVLFRGRRDRVAYTFAAMTVTIVGWNLALFSLYFFDDENRAEWWSRIFRVGICLAPAATFHATLALAGHPRKSWRTLLLSGYAAGLLLAAANLQGMLVRRLIPDRWGWYILPTPLYSVIAVLLVVYLLLSMGIMWDCYRHPVSARQHTQAKFFFLAAIVQVPFVFTNLLHVYGINILPLGNLGNVVWVGLIAYAIVRHRFMDVDYLVRKIVSFALAAVAVLTPGTLGLVALAGHLGSKDPLLMGTSGATLGLIAALLVPMLQKALETHVHRAFFPHRYDYRLRLRDLAAELVHVLDERALVARLGQSLSDILEVDCCEIYLRDPTSRRLAFAYPVRDDDAHPPESVCRELETLTAPVLADELAARESYLVPFFRDRGWEVAVPLRINERLTGLVALGRDREFRLVSGEDLTLLETVAGGASVALENARLSQELRRSEAVLQRANRLSSLGMLAAGIAHEIRNPLTAVKTFLDLLPTRLDDKEFLTTFRDLSASELRRVTNLINDLLALGKSTTAERRPVAIEPTIEPVVRLMESTARKRGLEMRIDIEAHAPEVLADADQLKQIVLNLLLNAIEANASGNGHVRLAVVSPGPDVVTIEINDDGPGIPAEQLDTIFEPFFTTKETGTGLGLALVHQMVVEHHGEITVESEVGEGTTFRVSLPTAQSEMLRTGT